MTVHDLCQVSTAKQINIVRKAPCSPVWQRNYYEHVIRNEKALEKIREYIINNPEVERLKFEEFYDAQFEKFSDGKNILFLNPQLSGKQLYKTFLPYLGMYNAKIFTALSGVEKYNPREQLEKLKVTITSKQIIWADFIVIPFTSENLTRGENNTYEAIRRINEQCKIVCNIDFNFYELSDLHPYKDIFTEEAIWNSSFV